MSKDTTLDYEDLNYDLDFIRIHDIIVEDIKEQIRIVAPNVTGFYADGIVVTETVRDGVTRELTIHNKGKHKTLGHLLEFGTIFAEPDPHYKPTFDRNVDPYEEAMRHVTIIKKNK